MDAKQARLISYPSLYGIAALLLWLLPFFWTGWTQKPVPFLPKSMSFQHSAAGLFTHRSTRWWDHHLEVQGADDRRHELEERAVFPMGAFGYRTRYDRILNESQRSRMSGEIRQRLAEHVVEKAGLGDRKPHPPTGQAGTPGGLSDAKALRLVRTVWPVGSPELALPEGSWNPPPVTEVQADRRLVLGTYKLVEGRVVEVPRQKPAQSPPPPRVDSPRPQQPRPRLPAVRRTTAAPVPSTTPAPAEPQRTPAGQPEKETEE